MNQGVAYQAPIRGPHVDLVPLTDDDGPWYFSVLSQQRFIGLPEADAEFTSGGAWQRTHLCAFAVVGRHSGKRLGVVAATDADLDAGHVQIGACATRAATRLGVVAEAAGMLIDVLFASEDLQKVYLSTTEASLPFFGHAFSGPFFREEARLKGHVWRDGKLIDSITYAVYRETWIYLRTYLLPRFGKPARRDVRSLPPRQQDHRLDVLQERKVETMEPPARDVRLGAWADLTGAEIADRVAQNPDLARSFLATAFAKMVDHELLASVARSVTVGCGVRERSLSFGLCVDDGAINVSPDVLTSGEPTYSFADITDLIGVLARTNDVLSLHAVHRLEVNVDGDPFAFLAPLELGCDRDRSAPTGHLFRLRGASYDDISAAALRVGPAAILLRNVERDAAVYAMNGTAAAVGDGVFRFSLLEHRLACVIDISGGVAAVAMVPYDSSYAGRRCVDIKFVDLLTPALLHNCSIEFAEAAAVGSVLVEGDVSLLMTASEAQRATKDPRLSAPPWLHRRH